jgi:hypothetical protein
MEGPAAVELLRDAMDMAYLKGKMDGVNEGFSLVVKPVSEIMEEAERAREAEIQDASLRRALAKAAEMIAR